MRALDLFETTANPAMNLLPYDGTVYYYGILLNQEERSAYRQALLQKIQWKNDELMMYGKKIITKRMTAWYGDQAYRYTYSKTDRFALPWTDELLQLKQQVEALSGETYNSCLLNLYHNGEEAMGWHTDAEKELKKNGAIASVSLGAERKFVFKHKRTAEKITMLLEDGSLLVMKDTTQTHWLHALPASKKIKTLRINLTFRTIVA